jgi:hypothetical protein
MQTYLQLPSPLGRRIDDRLRARTSQHPERLGMSDAAMGDKKIELAADIISRPRGQSISAQKRHRLRKGRIKRGLRGTQPATLQSRTYRSPLAHLRDVYVLQAPLSQWAFRYSSLTLGSGI